MKRLKDADKKIHEEVEVLRKRVELLENKLSREKKCQRIVELVSDLITIIDANGRILNVSPSFKRSLDYDPSDVIGKTVDNYIHPDDLTETWEKLSAIIENPNNSASTTCRVLHRNGSYRYFESYSSNYLHDPDIQGIITSSRDITERMLAEQDMHEERNRAQTYLDIAGVIMLVLNAEGRVTLINRKGCEILGCAEKDVIGKNWFDEFLPPDIRNDVKNNFMNIIAGNIDAHERSVRQVLTKPGEKRTIQWHNSILKEDDGTIIGTLSSGEDITEWLIAEEARVKSARSYRLLFENNPYPMWAYDRETLAFLAVNKAAIEHYGFSRDEFLSMRIKDILPEDDIPRFLESMKVSPREIEYGEIWRHIIKDGTNILVESSSNPIEFDGREAQLVLLQDITLHKRIEESLKFSEEKYHSLFNSMSEGVVIVQPVFDKEGEVSDFIVIDINPVFETYLKLHKDDIVGKRGSEIAKLKDISFYTKIISYVLKIGRPYTMEVNYDALGIVFRASVFEFSGGIISAIFEDITDRKHALDELEQKREQLEIMLKQEKLIANVASVLNSTKGFNNTVVSILKQLKEENKLSHICLRTLSDDKQTNLTSPVWTLSSCKCAELNNEFCLFDLKRFADSVLNGKECIAEDLSMFTKVERSNLQAKNIRSFVILPIIVGDVIRGMMCFGKNHPHKWPLQEIDELKTVVEIIANAIERDFSVRARLDAERKQTLAVRMAERASRLASLGTMAAGIAHEINQPLNALSFAVDGMRYWKKRHYEISPETIDENLAFISLQISRISDIISNMRSLAKMDRLSEPERVHVNVVVNEVVSLLMQQCKVHDIAVELNLSDDLPPVLAHQSRLHQVITNLVMNAFQALDEYDTEEKVITVTTSLVDDGVELTVADNGPGIQSDIIDHLFDPFFTTKTGGDTMGLGLFITHTIITEIDGVITAENQPGGGAVFTVTIPCVRQEQGVS